MKKKENNPGNIKKTLFSEAEINATAEICASIFGFREIKITSEINFDSFKIFINSLLHCSFLRSEYVGIYSYKDGIVKYGITIYTKSGNIELKYDCVIKWKSVLIELNKIV